MSDRRRFFLLKALLGPAWVAALLVEAGCAGEPLPEGLETGPLPDAGDPDSGDPRDADPDDPALDAGLDADPDVTDDSDTEDDRICPANGDGALERAEVLVSFEHAALYAAAPSSRNVPVDLAGEIEDGARTWHFEEPVPGEEVVEERARPLERDWVLDAFPTATHLARLSDEYGTSGVYRLDDEALWLLGAVSDEGQGTSIAYDPPVPLLRFPMAEGDTWTVTTTGSGRMSWVPFWDTEEYVLTVDASGVVVVPAGRFTVLRVRSELTQVSGMVRTHRIAYSFMAECWGRVAQVVSREGERDSEFSLATEYRRLTFE